jgi:hypothetical protein
MTKQRNFILGTLASAALLVTLTGCRQAPAPVAAAPAATPAPETRVIVEDPHRRDDHPAVRDDHAPPPNRPRADERRPDLQ